MSDSERLAEPQLTTAHAVAQSMAIGPIYSAAIFGSLIAATAGSAGPFVVVLAGIGVLALGWVVSRYGRTIAGPGAVYEYISATLGRFAGVASSFGYAYSLLFLAIPFAFPAGVLFQAFARQHLGFSPAWWVGGAGAAVIVCLLQSCGVALSVRVQLTLTGLSAIPIAIAVVAVVVDGGASGNTASVFNPSAHHHGDVFQALLYAITLFIGFETAASLGEEVKDPHRTIPRAILASVALTAVWYVIILYAGTIGFGPAHAAAQWGASPNGLAALADRYVGSADGTLIQIGVMVDIVAVWMASTNSFSRTLFALSRDGLMPAVFRRTTARGVPWAGTVTWVAATIALLLVTAASGMRDKYTMLTITVTGGVLVILVIYFVLAVGSLKLIPAGPLWLVPAVGAVTVGLGFYGTIHPFPSGVLRWEVWLALIGLAGPLVITALVSRRGARDAAVPPGGEPPAAGEPMRL